MALSVKFEDYGLLEVDFWDPLNSYGVRPPCPYGHGWDAVEQDQVVADGLGSFRRVSGMGEDRCLGCRQFKCKLCERGWMVLRRKFTNHRGSAAAKARAKVAMDQKLYKQDSLSTSQS